MAEKRHDAIVKFDRASHGRPCTSMAFLFLHSVFIFLLANLGVRLADRYQLLLYVTLVPGINK